MVILSALLSVYLKMNGVLMTWMLHHSRVKNFVRAIITRMKKTVSQETTNDARNNTSFWVSPGRCEQWWFKSCHWSHHK